MKKPSFPGVGNLGQQSLGQRIATTKFTSTYRANQRGHKLVLPTPADFYSAEIEGLREYNDNWAWGCCPFHPDSNPSFTVNLESGTFRCMSSSCGVKGSGIVSFVCQLHGLNVRQALAFLEDLA